jgi:hypothetical protein
MKEETVSEEESLTGPALGSMTRPHPREEVTTGRDRTTNE